MQDRIRGQQNSRYMEKSDHNRKKTVRLSQNQLYSSNLRQTRGILNRPPGSIPDKFTFQKVNTQSTYFCGCCPSIMQTSTQIYLSPSQVLTKKHFMHNNNECC